MSENAVSNKTITESFIKQLHFILIEKKIIINTDHILLTHKEHIIYISLKNIFGM